MLAGATLSQTTVSRCERWQPGALLLPMSDSQAETHVTVTEGGRRRAMHFQEWWVRYRAGLAAEAVTLVHSGDLLPAPGVLEAISDADVVLLPPSNPVGSIGTVLQVRGIREALAAKRVVGLYPHRRRLSGARDGRRLPGRDRRRDVRAGGGPALRQRPARRLAGGHSG